jgi:hypothetical protein
MIECGRSRLRTILISGEKLRLARIPTVTKGNEYGRNRAKSAAILHIFNKTKCVNPVSNIADAVRKYRVGRPGSEMFSANTEWQ